jgi:outer membrane protein assembly factor BamB
MTDRKTSPPINEKNKPLAIALIALIALAGVRLFYWYLLEQQVPTHIMEMLGDEPLGLSRIFPFLVNHSAKNVLSQKWVRFFNQDATFYTSPVLGADGTLYLAAVQGRIIALDRSSATKWEYRTDSYDFISGGMFLDRAGNLYFATLTKVYSLSPDGQQRWMTQCSPAKLYQGDHGGTFDGDVMYVSCGNSFHALNKDVGSDIWSLPALDYETSPVVRDGKIFAVRDQRVAAIGSDGVQLWAYPPTLHSPYDPRRASLNLHAAGVWRRRNDLCRRAHGEQTGGNRFADRRIKMGVRCEGVRAISFIAGGRGGRHDLRTNHGWRCVCDRSGWLAEVDLPTAANAFRRSARRADDWFRWHGVFCGGFAGCGAIAGGKTARRFWTFRPVGGFTSAVTGRNPLRGHPRGQRVCDSHDERRLDGSAVAKVSARQFQFRPSRQHTLNFPAWTRRTSTSTRCELRFCSGGNDKHRS